MPHLNNNDNSSSVLPYNMTEEWITYGFEKNHKFEYKLFDYDPVSDQVMGCFKIDPASELTVCKWNFKTGRCMVNNEHNQTYDLKKDDLWRIFLNGNTIGTIQSAMVVWDHFIRYAERVRLFKDTKMTKVDEISKTSYFLKMIITLITNKNTNYNYISFSQILEYVKKDL